MKMAHQIQRHSKLNQQTHIALTIYKGCNWPTDIKERKQMKEDKKNSMRKYTGTRLHAVEVKLGLQW